MLFIEPDGFLEHIYLFFGCLWILEIFQEVSGILAFQHKSQLYGMSHSQNLGLLMDGRVLKVLPA